MPDEAQDTQPQQDATVAARQDVTAAPDDPQRKKAYDNDIRHAKSVGAKMAMEALLKDVGLTSADDLKALIKAAKDKQDADKTELKKAQDALTTATQKATAAEQQLQAKVLELAISQEATRQGFIDPADAVLLSDRASLKINDDDTVSGVEEAVKKLAESKPHLLKQAGGVGKPALPSLGATQPAGSGQKPSGIQEKIKALRGGKADTSIFGIGGGVVGSEE